MKYIGLLGVAAVLALWFATGTPVQANTPYCMSQASKEVCDCAHKKVPITFEKSVRDAAIAACRQEVRAKKRNPRNTARSK